MLHTQITADRARNGRTNVLKRGLTAAPGSVALPIAVEKAINTTKKTNAKINQNNGRSSDELLPLIRYSHNDLTIKTITTIASITPAINHCADYGDPR